MQGFGEEVRVFEESNGDTDSLSGCVVLALCNEVDSICLVKECRELEENFGTQFTEAITSKNSGCLRQMKKVIMDVDRRRMLERCEEKATMIAKVAECPGWAKLWDHTLDLHGVEGSCGAADGQ